jgi:hypothetical protein
MVGIHSNLSSRESCPTGMDQGGVELPAPEIGHLEEISKVDVAYLVIWFGIFFTRNLIYLSCRY